MNKSNSYNDIEEYSRKIFTKVIPLAVYLTRNPYYLKYLFFKVTKKPLGFSKLFHWWIEFGIFDVFPKITIKVLLSLLRHADYIKFTGKYIRSQIQEEANISVQQVSNAMTQLCKYSRIIEKFNQKGIWYYRVIITPPLDLIRYLEMYSKKNKGKRKYYQDVFSGKFVKMQNPKDEELENPKFFGHKE